MRRFERPSDFETALIEAAAAVLPSARVISIRRTMIAAKVRIDLGPTRFVDCFFNARNQRMDLSVIDGGVRVLGYDNLGGWHRHPWGRADEHEPCAAPTLDQVLREVAALSSSAPPPG